MHLNVVRSISWGRLTLVLSMLMFAGCDSNVTIRINTGEQVDGSGTPTSVERSLGRFDQIRVSNAISASLSVGDASAVVVSGDDNIVPLVLTDVKDGTLTVRFKDNTSVTTKTPLKVEITTEAAPSAIDVSGASRFNAAELENDLTSIVLSGASRLQIDDLKGDELRLELSGASHASILGTASRLSVEASGASTAELSQLAAETATVEASGASTVKVQADQSIRGEASGASTVVYSGQGPDVDVETSGASSLKSGS